MNRYAWLALTSCLIVGCGDDSPTVPSATPSPGTSTRGTTFFVSSSTSTTGNLAGLRGADTRCQSLALGAGLGSRKWQAYLSVEHDPDNGNGPTDARNRIGAGPWINAAGATVGRSVEELHARSGDAALFVDEMGQRINGQWPGSPSPVEHDILTGSTGDGRLLAGMTCSDWTSASASQAAQVGHSDGLGPNANATPPLSSWNSAHANESCANTAPRGGAGRIYCFAVN
jgi:hypothetical protein